MRKDTERLRKILTGNERKGKKKVGKIEKYNRSERKGKDHHLKNI